MSPVMAGRSSREGVGTRHPEARPRSIPALGLKTRPPGRILGRRLLVQALILLLIISGVFGIRMLLHNRNQHPNATVSAAHPAAAVPISPQLEATWGLRFTNVIVVADNGGVELRYQVLDDGKAAKIHQGTVTTNQLPTLVAEGSGAKITPSSVLMHFHHGDPTAGRSYSIVYGNAGGAVRSGDFLTIIMKDGLKLKHVQVSD